MSTITLWRRVIAALYCASFVLCSGTTNATENAGGESPIAHETRIHPSVTLIQPRGKTRLIDFETDKGTWMSVDISPDKAWIVFDLLGHIYKVPARGGEAINLTENSGSAINYQPAYSPDGEMIAFVSDRAGQDNLWIMRRDGEIVRNVFPDDSSRFREPAWSADGKTIYVSRFFQISQDLNAEIWAFPAVGGDGRRVRAGIVKGGGTRRHYVDAYSPSPTPDGRFVFYGVNRVVPSAVLATVDHFIERIDLHSGEIEFMRPHPSVDPLSEKPTVDEEIRAWNEALGGHEYIPPVGGFEMQPEVSPNGKWVAFAMNLPGTTQVYRGHEFGPRTALFIRNLATGEERKLLDPITIDQARFVSSMRTQAVPSFAWTRDSAEIVISNDGSIHRVDIASGKTTVVPFKARVRRILSEQVRAVQGDFQPRFKSRFVRWPTLSPTTNEAVVVAADKLWRVNLQNGIARPLVGSVPGDNGYQYAAAWSPDGRFVAFTTWHGESGGHVWRVAANGAAPERLTETAGAYFYPTWSPDGTTLAVATTEEGLNTPSEWYVATLPSSGGPLTKIDTIAFQARPNYLSDGRIAYLVDTEEGPLVRTHTGGESAASELLRFSGSSASGIPGALSGGLTPALSPDAKHVAYLLESKVYVAAVAGDDGSVAEVAIDAHQLDTGSTLEKPGAQRLTTLMGGYDPQWIDSERLLFASGSRYIIYNVTNGQITHGDLDILIPRPTHNQRLALRNGRIVTVDGEVIERGDVVVEGSRIACVGRCDTARVDYAIDLTGKTIVPGFFDTHSHFIPDPFWLVPDLHADRQPRFLTALSYGVTTAIDPGHSRLLFSYSELIDAGAAIGPRLYTTEVPIFGELAETQAISTPSHTDWIVDRRVRWGAALVKPFKIANRRKRQWIVEAARSRNVTVTAEPSFLYQHVAFAIDGMTGWEHLIPELQLYEDVIQFFASAGVQYTLTTIIAGHNMGNEHYFRPQFNLAADEKYRRFMPPLFISSSALETRYVLRSEEVPPKHRFSFPLVAQGLADFVRAGGASAGFGEHSEQPGLGTHWEMWAAAEALTPVEVITAATLHSARWIGLEHELGSVTPGKIADLVILNSNPLVDIRNTTDIAYVMKAGQLYDDDTLDPIWPDIK